MEDLALWDEKSVDERIVLLKKVVLMEKEYLGIEGVDFIFFNDKLDKYTYGYYSEVDEQIRLNILMISTGDLWQNLSTVCHGIVRSGRR